MTRLAVALLGLLTITACADDIAPVRDMATTPADLTTTASCDGTVDVSHICNASPGPGFCLYRDTNQACVVCRPVGCTGALGRPDQGADEFICVTSCNDCQPVKPSFCFTE